MTRTSRVRKERIGPEKLKLDISYADSWISKQEDKMLDLQKELFKGSFFILMAEKLIIHFSNVLCAYSTMFSKEQDF